jgi:hypothetical protein
MQVNPYPVSYDVARPERYNRWHVGFRFILAIPLFILVSGFSLGRLSIPNIGGALGGLLLTLAVYAWFTILFTGRFPEVMRSTAEFLFRWSVNIGAYLLLLTDPYPPFGNAPYPVALGITPAEQYNRWTVGFRWLLVIPHLIVLIFLGIALYVVTIIAWFAILFTGEYPQGLFEFSVGVTRWYTRVSAYIYLFVDEYPPFTLASEPGGGLQPAPA